MDISSIFNSYINSTTQSSMIDALSTATASDGETSETESNRDSYTLELASLFNIDVSSILASSDSNMEVRQAIVELQKASMIDYSVLIGNVDSDFASLISTTSGTGSGSASSFFTEDYMSNALEMLATNPDVALVAQASLQSTTALDLFA